MPREDVPYPTSAICSIRERIAELRDELDQLLKTVNGVSGDANHDIKLISGDPAIVINNDAAQHEIEIALDSSQLPAASVSSVNGQVGVVDLDGADIPLNPGQSTPTVQNAVAANSGNITNLQNALAQEITDRGNADAALQTNINAALATIPGEVASQIASDATIAGLVAADAQNVKLTGAQNIGGVKTVPLQTTGQYSGQIASSQKVKNELDNYAPMLRTTGNQAKSGVFTLNPIANIPLIIKKPTDERDITPASNQYTTINITDNNNATVASITRGHYTNGISELILTLIGEGNKTANLRIVLRNDATGYLRVSKPDGTSTDLVTW